MLPERSASELSRALALFGLDLNRYTAALADGFVARWPTPEAWASPEARAALIATFAIGETTFMRHPEQFSALRALLPELHTERHGAPIRAWSAGCASGEEAYSLAATLASAGRKSFGLVAWDVNPDAIARAQLAEYRPWSLRGVEEHATDGWLEPAPCGVRVEGWLRECVSFQVGNLYLDSYPTDLDVVFCRNVLLYFRPEAAARVLARIAASLRPGGVLFLGHYDPRPGPETGLVAESSNGATFYRKPAYGLGLVAAPPIETLRRPLRSDPRALLRRSQPPLVHPAEASPASRMARIRLLVNQRRTDEALAMLSELGGSAPLLPELHVLTALAAEDAGDARLMLHAARRACFLVPDQPAPNYFLSVAFVRNGELRRAAVHRRIAAASLKHADRLSSIVDFGEGLTVGQLRRLIGAIAR